MKKNYKIKILDAKKDSDLLFKIVEHENKVFGEATVGNWNIKPFAKYGKVFAMLSDDKDSKDELMSVIKQFWQGNCLCLWSFYCPKISKKRICENTSSICNGNFEGNGNKKNRTYCWYG